MLGQRSTGMFVSASLVPGSQRTMGAIRMQSQLESKYRGSMHERRIGEIIDQGDPEKFVFRCAPYS